MKEVELKDIARLRTTKIECSSVSNDSYIGTDNMRQDKAGITPSIYAPKTGTTPAYHINDILISNIRPYLKKIWLADRSGGCSTDITVIQVNNELANPVFVYYCLIQNSFFDYLMLGAKGTKMPRLDKAHLMRYRIPLFDKKTQDSIADLLSVLDSRRHTNDRINENLEKLMREIYDYWFVQFDFPDANGRPYKSSGGEMVYNETLKREIPKGWGVTTLGELYDIYQPGILSAKQCDPDGEYEVHGSNGIIGRYHEYNHEDSEIIISCRGDCGNIHRVMPKTWITGNAMVVKPKAETIQSREYLKNMLGTLGIKNISTGSVQGQITRTNLAPIKIVVPNNDILEKYAKLADPSSELVIKTSSENKKLEELRDWLLPMLMNGQIKVSD